MTTEKPDIRILCRRCRRDYESAGKKLTKIWCEYKSDCELCGWHEGYEYILKEERK